MSAASERDRLARLELGQLGEPGDLRIASLAAELGARRLVELLAAERDQAGVGRDVAARREGCDPERDLERAQRMGIRFIVPGDAEWPVLVDDLDSADPVERVGGAPLGLWVRGPLRLDELPRGVAIVGARSATTYGGETATEIASGVARAGLTVVSGAAFGIDTAAHRGALAGGGPTVAVLACGADRVYPKAAEQLLDHLAAEGVIVSELAPGRSPTRLRFLARNRLIAALCRGTVLVEAAKRSGALNTANWTGKLNRPLMAVPGPVTSAQSEGVHRVLRSGAATLVTSAEEVLETVGDMGEYLFAEPRGPARPRDQLDRRQQQVLEAVPVRNAAMADSIARTAGLGLVDVRTTLGVLEGLGLVRLDHVGWRLAGGAG